MVFSSSFLAIQSSFWPILVSVSLFSTTASILIYLNNLVELWDLFLRVFWVGFIAFLWWKDFSRERLLGYHSHKLEVSLRRAILLFILSEVFFFFVLFLSILWFFSVPSNWDRYNMTSCWNSASFSIFSSPFKYCYPLIQGGFCDLSSSFNRWKLLFKSHTQIRNHSWFGCIFYFYTVSWV